MKSTAQRFSVSRCRNHLFSARKLLATVAASVLCLTAGVFALVMSGCDDIDQIADNASKRPPVQSLMPPQIDTDPEAHQKIAPQQPANNPPAQNPAPAAEANPPAAAQNPAAQPAQVQPPQPQQGQPAQQPQQAAQPEPAGGQEEMMTLGANTGVQGQGYGGGLITEPVHQFFSMRNLITWDQIKHDMDIWQAIHNRYPKTAQEFQKEILEPANIELPELPRGNRYVYDPKTGELMVARAKQQ
jgi:hypothetical protein